MPHGEAMRMELRPVNVYARELKPLLPASSLQPARSRALWLPLHVALVATLAWSVAHATLPRYCWPVVSLTIGCCFAGATFVGHETLHGAVVRGRWAIRLLGWLGFLPFTVSPLLWMAWHNRVHHHHCGDPVRDTDAYPTLAEYRAGSGARLIINISPGHRRRLGFVTLLIGMTLQSLHMLAVAVERGFMSERQRREALLETGLGIAFWGAVAWLVGWPAFMFVYVLPLLVANAIVMAFIVTNHCLSPQSEVNDPLHNSLSVTLPRWLEWLTVGFGYHVEHHLFPNLSTRHGPEIRALLLTHYPERYQSMSLVRALHRVFTTARVYEDANTLVDPESGRTWSTLQPRVARDGASEDGLHVR
jgi:fatty acid desaturase